VPTQDDLTVEDAWLHYIQRTINFFYRCAAVESIDFESASLGVGIRLRLGIDATWIEPHLEDFSAHITEARAAAGLSALGRLRATAMK
jgi:hypothetical protein